MLYLGFIINIVLYVIPILAFVLYFLLFFLKKNALLERFINIIFLAFLIVIMGLSWSLIIMNQGFDVHLFIHIDYSYVIVIALPIMILYEVLDTLQRKKVEKSDKWYVNIRRYLLPILTGVLFFIITLVFYFNCNYFSYLRL